MTDPGLALLLERGADAIVHPGGTLGAHLRRVGQRLAAHGLDAAVCTAGVCHAAYGTAGFAPAPLGLDERADLRAQIGSSAEAHVYEYASCDRRLVYPRLDDAVVAFADRFTGTTTMLPRRALRAFAAITVANELDIVEHGALDGADLAAIRRLLARLRDLLTPAASADVDRLVGVTPGHRG